MTTEKFVKKINRMLVAGIILSNLFLIAFVIFFSIDDPDVSINKDKKKFVKLEIASWVFGTLTAIILITSSAYTVVILKRLYGNDFSRTTGFMIIIVVTFCLAFGARTLYEWIMYFYYRKEQNPNLVLDMMQVMTVFMPILWDLFPIWIIFVLHHDNYSKQARYN
jgi:hypothetical protein